MIWRSLIFIDKSVTLLLEVAKYSPAIGKIWMTFLFLFRLFTLVNISGSVFVEDVSHFTCNTLTPGCQGACFNKMINFSHVKFWQLQLLLVATPSVIFVLFSMQRISTKLSSSTSYKLEREKNFVIQGEDRENLRRRRTAQNDDNNTSDSCEYDNRDDVALLGRRISGEHPRIQGILVAYVVQAVCRTIIEALFLGLQCYFFQFYFPDIFICEEQPCKNQDEFFFLNRRLNKQEPLNPGHVECFNLKWKEKTFFHNFMLALTALSLILNLIELIVFVLKWIRDSSRAPGDIPLLVMATKSSLTPPSGQANLIQIPPVDVLSTE
ncbi:gap junction Cx32.2 protein-like [Clavelina lepadiformis]|uniref:gap junction Cx32.2 protein-like n=1 Tax=Clavelina lepadiformis TaxID=159417 RepID=UPI004042A96B